MVDMFIKADEILHHSVKGITDLIMMPGHVNLDFADVRATMQKAGKALMGIGIGSGENRAVEAAERAISHPLLEDISISGAKGVLMNITSSSDLTLDEMTSASDRIYQEVGDDADIIWGQTFDEELGDEMRITVIATGIDSDEPGTETADNIHRFERAAAKKREYQRSDSSSQDIRKKVKSPATGYVRTPTAEELKNWNEYENPVKVVGGEDMTPDYRTTHIDNNDLEIPTFLRRKAD